MYKPTLFNAFRFTTFLLVTLVCYFVSLPAQCSEDDFADVSTRIESKIDDEDEQNFESDKGDTKSESEIAQKTETYVTKNVVQASKSFGPESSKMMVVIIVITSIICIIEAILLMATSVAVVRKKRDCRRMERLISTILEGSQKSAPRSLLSLGKNRSKSNYIAPLVIDANMVAKLKQVINKTEDEESDVCGRSSQIRKSKSKNVEKKSLLPGNRRESSKAVKSESKPRLGMPISPSASSNSSKSLFSTSASTSAPSSKKIGKQIKINQKIFQPKFRSIQSMLSTIATTIDQVTE